MKTLITTIIGALIVGIALWGSTKLDEIRERSVQECVRWEVDYNNQITCVEYE